MILVEHVILVIRIDSFEVNFPEASLDSIMTAYSTLLNGDFTNFEA